MNVTVADCLKLPALREATLVAGSKGLDRSVSSVSVLEWPDTSRLSDEIIVGNELIISAFIVIKDDVEQQCAVLRRLHTLGSAGVVLFYVGVFIPEISPVLMDTADELSFPLIVMPIGRMDFRYSDVITDVVEHIHTQRMQGSYYATEVMNSITFLEPRQRNVNSMLRLLSDRMHCTLLLADRYFERRGAAAWPASNQWDYQTLLEILQERKFAPQEQLQMELDGRQFILWDAPVSSKAHHGMHLLALDDHAQANKEMLQQAVNVVEMFLNIWGKSTSYNDTDALIEAVLTDDPIKMRKLAQRMGISIDTVHTVWLLRITNAAGSRELTPAQKADVIPKLKVYLQEHNKVVIVDSYESYIIAMTDGMVLEENSYEVGDGIVELLEKGSYTVRGCVFEDLENTSQARDAYNRVASCFAELELVYPQRKIYTDSDVRFVQSCVELAQQGENAVANRLLPIRKLLDTTDGSILTETLCTFLLDAESNTQRTGTLLFLHKNTVHYRLSKIRSVLKCDLSQMPATLAIYQAAAVYRILERH